MAGAGLLYNLVGLPAILKNREHDPETPYFLVAFLIMSTICIACYICLAIAGIHFVRGKTRLVPLFTTVLIFEVVYFFSLSTLFFSIGALWAIPQIGMSVATATGVANGGLMAQFCVLFPLWAPFAVSWAKGKRGGENGDRHEWTNRDRP